MVSSVSGAGLISYYQGQAALSLFASAGGGSSAASSASALLSYYQQKEGLGGASNSGQPAAAPAPTAPWNSGAPAASTAVQNAVFGQPFVDPGSARLDAPAGVSSTDYRNLFALYQGLNTLYDLASTAASSASSSSASNIPTSQLKATFASGMSQVENFLSNSPFSEFNLTSGSVQTQEQSTVGVPNGSYQTYTTGVIASGDESQALSVFQGNVQFNISVSSKYATNTITNPDGSKSAVVTPPTNIPIDLSGMGSNPRTIDNVVNYINSQLQAAKVSTRFAAANLGSTGTTTTLPNGQTETNKGTTQWGLTIKGSSSEVVSFSAPSTAAAVYVSSETGGAQTYKASTDPNTAGSMINTPTGQQLLKLQTDNDVQGTAPPTISNAGSTSNLPVGGIYAKSLPDGVSGIAASTTGSDGAVYLLANATGAVNSEPIQGGQGVVLLKYDAAGKLQYTKVVAGLQNATGSSIAVGADGTVAVAGTNTTASITNPDGLTTAPATAAFVQAYDSTGAPTWNQSVPALAGTSSATGVAIGADDSVYLSGQTTGSVGDQIPQSTQDEFIQGFSSNGTATFTKQFGAKGGTNSSAGLVYDSSSNTLFTAGLENSQAVVRSFAVNTTVNGKTSTTTATAGTTRNLGFALNVAGIGLSGGQVVVGGSAGAPTIHAGTVTQAYAGVASAFIASISSSLTPSSGDTVTYLGKSGVTQGATAMTIAGGQAYVTGVMANDPSSLVSPGAVEGFVSGVDTTTGLVSYSTRLAGANGQDAPTSIAVAATGSSILDQLGLPLGTVNAAQSNLVTASTSIRPGQSFWVRTQPGGPQTQIAISATDTMQTLVDKINVAIGGQGKAQVLNLGANSVLEIAPNDSGSFIELDAQEASDSNPGATASSLSSNVLAGLGLNAGVIRQVRQINGLTDVNQTREYGLDLPTNLDISTTTSAQHAANALQAAMSAVQQAYQDLATPPTIATEAAKAAQNAGTSTVPTYLTNEIANMQAGLNRLTAGQQSSGASSSNSLLSLFG